MKEDCQSQKGDRFSVGIKVTLDDQVRVLRNTIAENPNDSEAHKKLGFILSDEKYEKKNFQEAREHLKKAIELGLDDFGIRLRLGGICLKIKEYNEAEESYRKAIEFDSRCAEAHRGLGISLYQLKRYPEAKASLRTTLALQRGPRTPEMTEILAEIHINLAKVAFESKEYEECKKECESALELKPDFVQGYIWLGKIYNAKKDCHNAKEMFEKAITLNRNDDEPHYYLGLTFEGLKRVDEAEKEYKRAIELNPKFADAHCKLGLLFKSQKRFVEAILQLKKAIELEPDLIEAKESLEELTAQPPDKVKEAQETAKKSISEAEFLIKEMDDWHCQSLPGYNEAIKELNRAKDLIKISHYYGYIEATSSAEKSIEIAKKCILLQKRNLSEQFYQAKNKIEKLFETAKEYKAKKYYPEDYKELEEKFLQLSNSFTKEAYERITSSLQSMNELGSTAEKLISKSKNRIDTEAREREERLEETKKNLKAFFYALPIAAAGGILGWLCFGFGGCFCRVVTGNCSDPFEPFTAFKTEGVLGLIIGAIIGFLLGFFRDSG